MGNTLHILMPVLETSIGDREGVMISGECSAAAGSDHREEQRPTSELTFPRWADFLRTRNYDWLGLRDRERMTIAPKHVIPAPSR
jgi:hypothetical protein